MSGMTLEQLLARAVELEGKGDAASVEGAAPPELDPDLYPDLAVEEKGEGYDFEPDLDDPAAEVKAGAACPACGSTESDDFEDGSSRCSDCGFPLAEAKGYDFEPDEEVAGGHDFEPEPAEAKGHDFDAEPEPTSAEVKTAPVDDAGDLSDLDEFELLRARRAALSSPRP